MGQSYHLVHKWRFLSPVILTFETFTFCSLPTSIFMICECFSFLLIPAFLVIVSYLPFSNWWHEIPYSRLKECVVEGFWRRHSQCSTSPEQFLLKSQWIHFVFSLILPTLCIPHQTAVLKYLNCLLKGCMQHHLFKVMAKNSQYYLQVIKLSFF